MNEVIRQVVYRLKTLSYDLNTLQNRTISILFDILYNVNLETEPVPKHAIKHAIIELEGNREIMKRLIEDIDVIIRKLKPLIEQKEE